MWSLRPQCPLILSSVPVPLFIHARDTSQFSTSQLPRHITHRNFQLRNLFSNAIHLIRITATNSPSINSSITAIKSGLIKFEGFYHSRAFPRAERSHMGLIVQPLAG